MKMSVIVTVYNTEEYIEKCLDSIPKREDIEIIIVNDCSTDNSLKIIRKYIRGKENYILVNLKENKGVGNARNKAIDKATGEYLYMLDSDDTFDNIGVEKLLKDLTGEDVIYCGIRLTDGTELYKRDRHGVIRCIRREFLGDKRYPEYRIQEDTKLYKDVMLMNPTKKFLDYVVWNYTYLREGSLCTEYRKNRILLTIIIQVYNTEQYIRKCLDSIKLCTQLEILIIDDCSTDNSATIVKEWIAEQDANITFVQNETNMGASATFNKAIDIFMNELTGMYCMSLNDDDYLLLPIERFIKRLDGSDIVYHDLEINSGYRYDGLELPRSNKSIS